MSQSPDVFYAGSCGEGGFGGLSPDVARMMGHNVARANADYMRHEPQGKYGITDDDLRCDADSARKTADVVKIQRELYAG